MRRRLQCVLVLCALGAAVPVWGNTWVQWRGDSLRSGVLTEPLDLVSPGVRWRSSAGGVLSQDLVVDVNGDETSDLITVEGGRVVARSTSGSVYWDTTNLLAEGAKVVEDFNGDGTKEILVRRRNGVFLLSLEKGEILWESELSLPVEQIGSLLWDDLDNDGTLEILMADQAMNASKPYLTGGVFVFGFAEGWGDGTPTFVTEEGTRDYEVGRTIRTTDLNEDGFKEILATGKGFIYAYDGQNGSLVASSTSTGGSPSSAALNADVFFGISEVFSRDVNADGLVEIFVFSNTTFVGKPTRQVTVFSFDGESTLNYLWHREIGNSVLGTHTWPESPFLQRNGGQRVELLSNSFDPSSGWSLRFLNALSGEISEEKTGMRVLEVGDWGGNIESVLRVSLSSVQKPSVYEPQVFLEEGEDGWKELGLLTGNVFPLGKNGVDRFILVSDTDKNGWGDLLEVLSYPEMTPLLSLEADVLAIRQAVAEGDEGLFVYGPMGQMSLYELDTLTLMNDEDGNGESDLAVGGYGVTRVVAHGKWVAHGRAGGRIVVVDGSTGNPVVAPTEVLELVGSMNQQPIFFSSETGLATVVLTQETESRVLQVKAYTLDGEMIWKSTLGGDGGIYGVNREILVEDLNEDGVDDLVLVLDQSVQPSLHKIMAVNGKTGAVLWPPLEIDTPGGGIGQLSVEMETKTLFLTGNKVLYEWNVDTGILMRATTNASGHYYGRAIPVNLDGDESSEVLLIGTNKGALVFNEDRSERWSLDIGSATRATGVAALHNGETVMALANFQSPLLSLVNSAGEVFLQRVFAFGNMYPDLETAPEGASKSHLEEVLFAEDLTGEGEPAFLITSTDGFIYAVRLDGEIIWARSVEGAAGAPALFDADGDGKSELLIPSESGDVVAFDQTELYAPAWVREVTDIASIEDIDEQENCLSMSLAWESVIGATGYRIGLYTENGTFVFLSAVEGQEPSAELTGLSLSIGVGYFVRVSPTLETEGGVISGPETASNGVKVVDLSDPEITFFTVSPYALVPSEGTSVVTFQLAGLDAKGLDTYRISVRGTEGNVWQSWDGVIYSDTFELEMIWDGRKEDGSFAPSGKHIVRAIVEDFAGKAVIEEREMFLCPSPNRYDPLKGICYPPDKPEVIEPEEEAEPPIAVPEGNNTLIATGQAGKAILLPEGPSGCDCRRAERRGLDLGTCLGILWVLMMIGIMGRRARFLERGSEDVV